MCLSVCLQFLPVTRQRVSQWKQSHWLWKCWIDLSEKLSMGSLHIPRPMILVNHEWYSERFSRCLTNCPRRKRSLAILSNFPVKSSMSTSVHSSTILYHVFRCIVYRIDFQMFWCYSHDHSWWILSEEPRSWQWSARMKSLSLIKSTLLGGLVPLPLCNHSQSLWSGIPVLQSFFSCSFTVILHQC